MQCLCVTATRDHNVYASFRPSIATKDAETRSKMNTGVTLQTSRNTNKQDINTNFGNPHLTLKEGPKVKSDHTKRFPAHDFLDFGLPFQSSRTNNKRVISTFKFGYPRLTLMEGPRSNPTTAIDSQHMILCTILV